MAEIKLLDPHSERLRLSNLIKENEPDDILTFVSHNITQGININSSVSCGYDISSKLDKLSVSVSLSTYSKGTQYSERAELKHTTIAELTDLVLRRFFKV